MDICGNVRMGEAVDTYPAGLVLTTLLLHQPKQLACGFFTLLRVVSGDPQRVRLGNIRRASTCTFPRELCGSKTCVRMKSHELERGISRTLMPQLMMRASSRSIFRVCADSNGDVAPPQQGLVNAPFPARPRSSLSCVGAGSRNTRRFQAR